MAISLQKGQGVSLKKNENDLSLVTIGLGWDVKEEKKGFLGNLFNQKEEEYDLDVIAFLCGPEGKILDIGERDSSGKPTLNNGDVIFYNSMRHNSGTIWLTGDNRTGEGEGDDEQIIVKLNDIPAAYSKIAFIVQIYKGEERGQNFGKVKNAYIRAVDARDREMTRFDLSGGSQYTDCRSMLFAELDRQGNDWKFNAIGAPSSSDTFITFLKQYI